jgi:hypothetical protein
MDIKKLAGIALSVAVLGLAAAPSARADVLDKLTYVTFSRDVAIPGKVLSAGTYTFRVAGSQSDSHIVQIFNQNGTQLIATLLTVAEHRLTPTSDTVIMFGEAAGNAAPPVARWFYPGDTEGLAFLYPKGSHTMN